MKKNILKMMSCLLLVSSLGLPMHAQQFNRNQDLLLIQHDSTGDEDDIHSMAVEGCWLMHPDSAGVDFWAVSGTRNNQPNPVQGHGSMMNAAFGPNWSDAWANWNAAVVQVNNKVRPYLDNNGKVWIAEAGQSNFTRDWCELLNSEGVSASKIKNNVVLVQHSQANENATNNSDLAWVQANTNYIKIGDGNSSSGIGAGTPNYNSNSAGFRAEANSSNNPNAAARSLMLKFEEVIILDGDIHNPPINRGGVDF